MLTVKVKVLPYWSFVSNQHISMSISRVETFASKEKSSRFWFVSHFSWKMLMLALMSIFYIQSMGILKPLILDIKLAASTRVIVRV